MNEFKKNLNDIIQEYQAGRYQADFDNFIAALRNHDVVLFGAAWIGDFFYDKLTSKGIAVKCFCDNFAVGVSPAGHGPIIRLPELKEKYPRAKIIISCDKAQDIIHQQLLDNGFDEKQIICYPRVLLRVFTLADLQEHFSGYEWAYNFFQDALSKQIILERIRCYLFGSDIAKSTSPQYFEENLLQLGKNEVFVDGGFFIGDTAEEFIKQVNGSYKMIYGFEPDVYCRDKAAATLQKYKNIEAIPKGLYSKTTTLRFASTGGTSQASGGNIVEADGKNVINVPVTSLDEFFADKPADLAPTYIKMDIEGAEHAALLGASHTISRYKPKLAICIYHKPEDIYDLTKIIAELNPSYHFYLRHYANFFWETVLYAL